MIAARIVLIMLPRTHTGRFEHNTHWTMLKAHWALSYAEHTLGCAENVIRFTLGRLSTHWAMLRTH